MKRDKEIETEVWIEFVVKEVLRTEVKREESVSDTANRRN